MQYMRAYQSVFDNPKWMTNLLIGALCQIVPVVGPIVWLGYLFEGVQVMHRQQRDVYPDFDMNRLVPYLLRGLWVFLINLIPVLVLLPVIFLAYILVFAVAAAADEPGIAGLGMLCMVPLILTAQGALILVAIPLSLRAGLSQDLMVALNWSFLRDFISRVWQPMLLSYLFILVTGFPLMLLGTALCCVGAYPAAALVTLAHAHLEYQVYEEYLRAGGESIPIKEEVV